MGTHFPAISIPFLIPSARGNVKKRIENIVTYIVIPAAEMQKPLFFLKGEKSLTAKVEKKKTMMDRLTANS